MGRGDYERLTPEAIDQLWARMRAGHAPKPTARELGLSTSTVRDYLHRCGGIRPVPRHRATVGSRRQNARRSLVAWPLTSRCDRSLPAWAELPRQ